jgi:hypothetical protein
MAEKMKTVTVRVTEDNIVCGRRAACDQCPVALAILDLIPTPTAWEIRVTGAEVDYYRDGMYQGTAKLPCIVAFRIGAFDGGGDMLPFDFPLEVPDLLPLNPA